MSVIESKADFSQCLLMTRNGHLRALPSSSVVAELCALFFPHCCAPVIGPELDGTLSSRRAGERGACSRWWLAESHTAGTAFKNRP